MAEPHAVPASSPAIPTSATSKSDNPADVNRREFLQQAAAGGVVLASWTGVQMTQADDKKSVATDRQIALPVKISVNGQEHELRVEPCVTLLDALRHVLGLTGTKKGCDHGQCGSCTVLLNGKRVNSCLTLAVMQDGARITTIEGLSAGDELHPVQQAFIDHDAFQCGYCTPGQICSAAGLISEGHAHTPDEVRELMSGNICRCGAYCNIVAAIDQVLQSQKEGAIR
jgi:xanthine dehydrogenase YagT iron-sulfur-binding subunit